MTIQDWHALSVDTVIDQLDTNIEQGLSVQIVTQRHSEKLNQLPQRKPDTFLQRVARQFKNPIVLVLVFSTIVTVVLGMYADALFIAAALLINMVIGVYQEQRAAHTFATLHSKATVYTTVVRDKELHEINSRDIVVGDIVLLLAGSAVPADLRLVEAHELTANEITLTGEWSPIEKDTDSISETTVLAERTNMVYAGTLITGGSGRGVVVSVGTDTELGKIAVALATTEQSETPLVRDMRHIMQLLFILVVIATVLVFGVSLIHGKSLATAAIIAVAIAVASVPEGLPAAVTVVLAIGMERILATGGLVKNLLSAETLGATSVILTDKTGTLTEGRMRVVGVATTNGVVDDATSTAKDMEVLRSALLASDGYLEELDETVSDTERFIAHGRPIEQAIIFAGISAGLSKSVLNRDYPYVDELPFDSKRKFGGKLVMEQGTPVAYLSGAPEVFIEHDKDARVFKKILSSAAKKSERMIAVARVRLHTTTFAKGEEIMDLLKHTKLIGFIIFADTPRTEVAGAVRDIRAAGARVIMATGDNPETAIVVARAVGIATADEHPHIGTDIENLSDNALYQQMMGSSVFARVTPEDKLRMVRVLRDHKEVVAMTGDGINDAPALRSAAIGIAIGSGTDVAKEAADMVLLKDSFAVIVTAIREGRRLRDNMKKIFTYLVATNFSEAFLIIIALAAGLPLPLLPAQILWANLVTGGPMNVAFAFEPLYASVMKRKPKDPENAEILSKSVIQLIVFIGLATGMLLIALFFLLQITGIPETQMQTMMFVALTFTSLFTALSLKSFGTPLRHIDLLSNKFLVGSLFVSVIALLAALFLPGLQFLVHTVPLSGLEIGLLLIVGLADLAFVELAKYLFYIRQPSIVSVS